MTVTAARAGLAATLAVGLLAGCTPLASPASGVPSASTVAPSASTFATAAPSTATESPGTSAGDPGDPGAPSVDPNDPAARPGLGGVPDPGLAEGFRNDAAQAASKSEEAMKKVRALAKAKELTA